MSGTEAALELAIANLDRQFGKGTVVRLGDDDIEPWPSFSTGALTLDLALGIGGLPRGRLVEIFGPESSGKTTVALNVVAEAQSSGLRCAFIDVEHALDPTYAKALGVNLDELYVSQPDYGEAAIEVAIKLIETGMMAIVVVDSVAALTPKAELEGAMGDSHMGLLARLMGQAMRKMVGAANKNDTLVIFTNQLREKIGIVYGNPETQPGGRALKFAASVRIDIRRIKDVKNKEGDILGVETKAKIIKNKMAPPFKQAEFDIIYGYGIDKVGCLLNVAVDRGVVQLSGTWFSFDGKNIGQGKNNTVSVLRENPDLLKRIAEKL